MTVFHCLICGRSEFEVTKMFCFPKNPNRCRQWQEILGMIYEEQLPHRSRICNLHFSNDSFIPCMSTLTLRRDAVPLRMLVKEPLMAAGRTT